VNRRDGPLLALHLGAVLALFVTLPYGKFVHGFYRLAALWVYERAVDVEADLQVRLRSRMRHAAPSLADVAVLLAARPAARRMESGAGRALSRRTPAGVVRLEDRAVVRRPCVSCHTGMTYLLARPVLRRALHESEPTTFEPAT
jgi:hypothetical protein